MADAAAAANVPGGVQEEAPIAKWDAVTLASAIQRVGAGDIWERLSNSIVDVEVDGSEFAANATSVEQLMEYTVREFQVTLRHGQAEAVLQFVKAHSNGPDRIAEGEPGADAIAAGHNSELDGDLAANGDTSSNNGRDSAAAAAAGQEQDHAEVAVPSAEDSGGDGNGGGASPAAGADTAAGADGQASRSSAAGVGQGREERPPPLHHAHMEDVLQALRSRSVDFCVRHPRHSTCLLYTSPSPRDRG